MARTTPLSVPESDPRTCSAGTRVNALARVPFFAGLDHDTLHRVDDRADMQGIEAGEAVTWRGDPPTACTWWPPARSS